MVINIVHKVPMKAWDIELIVGNFESESEARDRDVPARHDGGAARLNWPLLHRSILKSSIVMGASVEAPPAGHSMARSGEKCYNPPPSFLED
jgi:hypothetical protein